MKKILLSICLTAISAAAFSQSDKTVTFGVKGGVNLSRMPYTHVNDEVTTSAGTLTTFNIGAFVDFQLSESISIQPALLFTGKGGRKHLYSANEVVSVAFTDTVKIYYLQVPVNLVYHVPVGDHSLYFGAGPFVGYGISGRFKGNLIMDGAQVPNGYFNEDIKFGEREPATAKRWDYGVGALAGFKFNNGFLFNINYDLGLANTIPKNDDNNNQAKTRVFGLSVGYAF